MSLLSTIRPLRDPQTITSQTIRSTAGVPLATTTFHDCNFKVGGSFNVSGSAGVQCVNYYNAGDSEQIDGSVNVSLSGIVTSLGINANNIGDEGYYNYEGAEATMTSGRCDSVSLYHHTNGTCGLTTNQTEPLSVTVGSVDWTGVYVTADSTAELNVVDNICVGLTIRAAAATTFSLSPSNASAGWQFGLDVTLGMSTFDVPFVECHNYGAHYWQGPFTVETVNAILARYASGSADGYLTIGGTAAAPTGGVYHPDTIIPDPGMGYEVGDTFTLSGTAGTPCILTVDAVGGTGEILSVTDTEVGTGYPQGEGVQLEPLSVTGSGAVVTTSFLNPSIATLLNSNVSVTTN